MKYLITLTVILAVVVGSQAWGCYYGGDTYSDGEIKSYAGKYCKCVASRITCGACKAMNEVFDSRINMSNGAYCFCAQGRVGCVGKKRSLEGDKPVDNSIKSLMELLKKNRQ